MLLRAAIGLLLLAAPTAAEERLLSLGGAVTETVFALDPNATVVGSDLTSQFPPRAASLPKVGYLRTLGAEGVLSLSPQLVLASADAGPPAAMRQIEAAGVRVLSLPEAHTPDAALERVRLVASAPDRDADAAAVMEVLRTDLNQVRDDVAALPGRPKILFLLSAGPGAPMAAGNGTAAEAMIRLAGSVNA